MPDDEPARTRPVLVSACLLGRTCRYDGRHNRDGALARELAARGEHAVPCCPEEEGGLATPRPAAWLTRSAGEVLDRAGAVVTRDGADVTAAFRTGAELALARCREHGAERAYLKERSPSCGVACTHVDGAPVDGPGLTAELLRRGGVEIVGVEGRRD